MSVLIIGWPKVEITIISRPWVQKTSNVCTVVTCSATILYTHSWFYRCGLDTNTEKILVPQDFFVFKCWWPSCGLTLGQLMSKVTPFACGGTILGRNCRFSSARTSESEEHGICFNLSGLHRGISVFEKWNRRIQILPSPPPSKTTDQLAHGFYLCIGLHCSCDKVNPTISNDKFFEEFPYATWNAWSSRFAQFCRSDVVLFVLIYGFRSSFRASCVVE